MWKSYFCILNSHSSVFSQVKLGREASGHKSMNQRSSWAVVPVLFQTGQLLNVVHRNPDLLHLMWVNETKIITASPSSPGNLTVISYWWTTLPLRPAPPPPALWNPGYSYSPIAILELRLLTLSIFIVTLSDCMDNWLLMSSNWMANRWDWCDA